MSQSTTKAKLYTHSQRRVALIWGVICHLLFGLAISLMMASLFLGLTNGRGPFQGSTAVFFNLFLTSQFGVLHSLALSKKGRDWMGNLPLAGVGSELKTTTFAILASLQILATFSLWSPIGQVWFMPTGWMLVVWTVAYAASWLYLLTAMWNSGLALQTGFLGWWAVWRQEPVKFPGYAMRGLYRETRQPIYFGFTLILWTAPTWTVDRLVLTLFWTAYCLVGPIFKELRIRKFSEDGYHRYSKSVPYWFPWPRKRWIETDSGVKQNYDCDVVIVGAGPVGLTLALILGRANLTVRLIEERSARSLRSRAIIITPPSLEILKSIGLADSAIREGLSIREASIFEDRKLAGKLSFEQLPGFYPFILSLPQTRLEELLEARIGTMENVTIHKGAVHGIEKEDARGISLKVAEGMIRARYAVACDGRHSRMRKFVQMPVRTSMTASRFVMADFADRSEMDSKAALFFTRNGAAESFPLPKQQRRWILQTSEKEPLDDAAILRQMKSRVGWSPAPEDRLTEWSSFQPEHQLCDRFFHGRVIFCGDAAHVLSPIGGQGMNLGLADAELAGECLKQLLAGPPSLRILERYDHVRRRAFVRAHRFTSFGMWIGTRHGQKASNLRELLISGGLRSRWVHNLLAASFAMKRRATDTPA